MIAILPTWWWPPSNAIASPTCDHSNWWLMWGRSPDAATARARASSAASRRAPQREARVKTFECFTGFFQGRHACGLDFEVALGFAAAFRRGIAERRLDKSLGFQALQRRVHAAD